MSHSALKQHFEKVVVPSLMKQFGYVNRLQVPRLVKVVVNVGYGRQAKDAAFIENVERTLALITGQKPVHNKARIAISNFKTRAGLPIGASVTLRGARMYDFVYKLVHLTFPRVRDFRGLSAKSFDRQGNCAIGFKENLAFPEIGSSSIDKIHGLEVIIVTTGKTREVGLALLKALGFPFRD
ncbi:MAG: 50S ribosomal protein L5 [Candidatus Magasanikbacteria bacterium]|nr:50S ribosomal protein L5 [Candidatus Magasanikbacteria bacterium]